MKTCKKCGKQSKDDAIFCAGCGEKIEGEMEMLNKKSKEDTITKKIKINKKMILVGTVVIVAIIAIVAVAVSSGEKIKIKDYYNIEYTGGNKFGTAKVDIDFDELEFAVCEKIGYSTSSMEAFAVSEMLTGKTVLATVTPNENLKNGDVVEVEVKVADPNMFDGVKLVGFKEKVKVEGLVDYKEIADEELFQDIEVIYTDYSPYLDVEIMNNSEDGFLSSVTYSVENNGKIKNGDTITINASWDESYANEMMCYVSGTGKKEVKVENQAKYILNKDEISEEMLNQLKEKLIEEYKQTYGDNQAFKEIKGITLVDATNSVTEKNHMYVLMEVEPDSYGDNQWYDVVYHNVKEIDGEIELGRGWSNSLFNFNNDTNNYDDNIIAAKSEYKAVYDLMEE